MKPKRPLIVSLLSVFLMFMGFGGLVVRFSNGYSKETLGYLASQCGYTGSVIRHFGIAGWNAELASFSVVAAVVGVGLWRLLPWARTATMVFTGLDICSAIEQTVEMHFTHSCTSVDLTSFFVGPVLLLYFSRKKIKQIFRPNLVDATPQFEGAPKA